METDKTYEFGVEIDSPRARGKSPTTYMGISLCLVSLALVGAVAGLIYQGISSRSDSTPVFCKPADVTERFPGYFRTPEQQAVYLKWLENISHPGLLTVPLSNCSVVCQNFNNRQSRSVKDNFQDMVSSVGNQHMRIKHNSAIATELREKREIESDLKGDIYHGCCSSQSSFVAPDEGETIRGEDVQIVQTEKYKQYFKTESCIPDPFCTICTCAQPIPFIYNAVAYADKDSPNTKKKYKKVDLKFPGCCKCLNVINQK